MHLLCGQGLNYRFGMRQLVEIPEVMFPMRNCQGQFSWMSSLFYIAILHGISLFALQGQTLFWLRSAITLKTIITILLSLCFLLLLIRLVNYYWSRVRLSVLTVGTGSNFILFVYFRSFLVFLKAEYCWLQTTFN